MNAARVWSVSPLPLTPLEAARERGLFDVKNLSLRMLTTTFAAKPYRSDVCALEAGRLVTSESGGCEEARSLWSRRERLVNQAPGGPIFAVGSSFRHLPLAGLDRPLQEEHP